MALMTATIWWNNGCPYNTQIHAEEAVLDQIGLDFKNNDGSTEVKVYYNVGLGNDTPYYLPTGTFAVDVSEIMAIMKHDREPVP
jgi:hypothetical protein